MALSVVIPQPPHNETPISQDTGQHSQAWSIYFQKVSDILTASSSAPRHGVTDGSDANAGDVGEFLEALSGTVGMVNNSVANVVSLDLPAGDWDVSGNVSFNAAAGTHTNFGVGIGSIQVYNASTFPSSAITHGIATPTRRYSVTSTTTVWLVAVAGYTASMTCNGYLRARRMR
jgi:hypothetical protein